MKMVKRYQIMNSTQENIEDTFPPPPFCQYRNTGTAKGRGRDRASGWWQEGDVLQMGCRIHCHKSSSSLEGRVFWKWAIRDLDINICMRWGKARGCVISFSISCWDWGRCFPGLQCPFVVSLDPFPRLLEVVARAGRAFYHQPSCLQHHHPQRRKQAWLCLKVKI